MVNVDYRKSQFLAPKHSLIDPFSAFLARKMVKKTRPFISRRRTFAKIELPARARLASLIVCLLKKAPGEVAGGISCL